MASINPLRAPTNLLDLPNEILALIIDWVSVLRYDYSESRRPKPSSLHHIAYGTNRLLRELALPAMGRVQRTSELSARLLMREGKMVDSRALARVLYYGEGLWSRDYVEAFPNVEQLVYSWTPADLAWALVRKGQGEVSMEQSWPSVRLFEMRHGRDPFPLFEDTPIRRLFPSLRRVNLVFCILERWLPLVAAHNTVIKLKVFMVNDGEVEGRLKDWPVELWERIEDLSVRLRSPRRGDGAELESGDYFHLQGFQLPATSPLRTLSISTHLSAHFVLDPRRMRDVVTALSASFSFASLTSLSLDEYATATPNDLHRLAAAFPALRRLSLGDRIVWEGSRSDFLSALLPLAATLDTLSCRIFPESPASTFRPPRSPLEFGEGEEEEEEEYASPASIAHEAASLLPGLSRVGFSGRQSKGDWFRIRRDGEGRPEEAERVDVFSLDMEGPRR